MTFLQKFFLQTDISSKGHFFKGTFLQRTFLQKSVLQTDSFSKYTSSRDIRSKYISSSAVSSRGPYFHGLIVQLSFVLQEVHLTSSVLFVLGLVVQKLSIGRQMNPHKQSDTVIKQHEMTRHESSSQLHLPHSFTSQSKMQPS